MARPGELFVMVRVPAAVREALLQVLAESGLDQVLGSALYAPRNWHQSLSDLHPPEAREHLRLACCRLEARAFCLQLDQLRSSGNPPGRIHWKFVPTGQKPLGMKLLLADVRSKLQDHGLAQAHGHRAHVTVSYIANGQIEPRAIAPVPWLIDAVELVEVAGRGADYRYEVVDTFPLRPAARPAPTQLGLLG
jgi:2'-5' RNA ligase